MTRSETGKRLTWVRTLLGAGALLVLMSGAASAQQPDQPEAGAQKKIESLKSAYLGQQLNLSPEEAKRFWPVYQQYQQQMESLAEKRRENQDARNRMTHPSDQEVDQALDRDFNLQQQALQLREQYRQRFRQIIPSQKVMQLYKSERDFNMKLIRELRQRGGSEPQARPAGRDFPRQQPASEGTRRVRPAPVRQSPARTPRPQPAPAPRSGGHARIRGR